MADTATDTQDPKVEEKAQDEAAKTGEAVEPALAESRDHDYVLVRHMARSRATHTLRAKRAGFRRQRFMLNDGTRIRRKGRQRFTEISFDLMLQNITELLEGITTGFIQVYRAEDQLDPMTLEEFNAFAHRVAGDKLGEFRPDAKRMEALEDLFPLHDLDVEGTPPEEDDEGEEEDEKPLTLLQDPSVDTTKEVPTESELIAAVDQHEAEMIGEANPPPSEAGEPTLESEPVEEEEGYTEEDLLKMSRKELNKLAKGEFGIEDADKLPNIPAVVQAILEAGSVEE